MTSPEPTLSRVEELLADRATEGLSAEDQAELQAAGSAQDETYDLAAAAADIALYDVQPMPAVIAGRVLARVGRAPAATTVTPIRPKSRAATIAVIVAAAAVALAIGTLIWARRAPVEVAISIPEQRTRLLLAAKDTITTAWTATDDPNGKGASGDVVWSPSRQEGYMRFVGLAPNDRAKLQYQLWIFDDARDAAYPVDGGVFDVGANGEVIVAITPRLHVEHVSLFAVTVEKPGGVVVSKRERIVVTAKPV